MNKPRTMIAFNDIAKVYYTGTVAVEALKNVNLSIEPGELVAVTGPSGSGKSTLMHIIGCLDTPTSGTYYLDDEKVSALSLDRLADVRNRKIGFVFQSFNLLPYLTAEKNIELPMVFAGTGAEMRRQRPKELLTLVGMVDRADHKPNQLSGGEQQRTAIARALANDPEIILADEPTGNLDSKSGKEIIDLFVNLWRQGHTIIVITHDTSVADRCPRRIHLMDGTIVNDERLRLTASAKPQQT